MLSSANNTVLRRGDGLPRPFLRHLSGELDKLLGNNCLRADRIRLIREKRGLSQHQLAEMCNIGINQIHRYEVGKAQPTAENLKLIAEKLGVSADYLLGLSNDERGQLGDTTLGENERDLIEVFQREGWAGVIRLGADRMAKPS